MDGVADLRVRLEVYCLLPMDGKIPLLLVTTQIDVVKSGYHSLNENGRNERGESAGLV